MIAIPPYPCTVQYHYPSSEKISRNNRIAAQIHLRRFDKLCGLIFLLVWIKVVYSNISMEPTTQTCDLGFIFEVAICKAIYPSSMILIFFNKRCILLQINRILECNGTEYLHQSGPTEKYSRDAVSRHKNGVSSEFKITVVTNVVGGG
jgi:hypothetical protein